MGNWFGTLATTRPNRDWVTHSLTHSVSGTEWVSHSVWLSPVGINLNGMECQRVTHLLSYCQSSYYELMAIENCCSLVYPLNLHSISPLNSHIAYMVMVLYIMVSPVFHDDGSNIIHTEFSFFEEVMEHQSFVECYTHYQLSTTASFGYTIKIIDTKVFVDAIGFFFRLTAPPQSVPGTPRLYHSHSSGHQSRLESLADISLDGLGPLWFCISKHHLH